MEVNGEGSGTEVLMFAAESSICTGRIGFVVDPKKRIPGGMEEITRFLFVNPWWILSVVDP